MKNLRIPFDRQPSPGFGVGNFVLTLCGHSVNIPFYFDLLLRKLDLKNKMEIDVYNTPRWHISSNPIIIRSSVLPISFFVEYFIFVFKYIFGPYVAKVKSFFLVIIIKGLEVLHLKIIYKLLNLAVKHPQQTETVAIIITLLDQLVDTCYLLYSLYNVVFQEIDYYNSVLVNFYDHWVNFIEIHKINNFSSVIVLMVTIWSDNIMLSLLSQLLLIIILIFFYILVTIHFSLIDPTIKDKYPITYIIVTITSQALIGCLICHFATTVFEVITILRMAGRSSNSNNSGGGGGPSSGGGGPSPGGGGPSPGGTAPILAGGAANSTRDRDNNSPQSDRLEPVVARADQWENPWIEYKPGEELEPGNTMKDLYPDIDYTYRQVDQDEAAHLDRFLDNDPQTPAPYAAAPNSPLFSTDDQNQSSVAPTQNQSSVASAQNKSSVASVPAPAPPRRHIPRNVYKHTRRNFPHQLPGMKDFDVQFELLEFGKAQVDMFRKAFHENIHKDGFINRRPHIAGRVDAYFDANADLVKAKIEKLQIRFKTPAKADLANNARYNALLPQIVTLNRIERRRREGLYNLFSIPKRDRLSGSNIWPKA